jgi:hypothetical protein
MRFCTDADIALIGRLAADAEKRAVKVVRVDVPQTCAAGFSHRLLILLCSTIKRHDAGVGAVSSRSMKAIASSGRGMKRMCPRNIDDARGQASSSSRKRSSWCMRSCRIVTTPTVPSTSHRQ